MCWSVVEVLRECCVELPPCITQSNEDNGKTLSVYSGEGEKGSNKSHLSIHLSIPLSNEHFPVCLKALIIFRLIRRLGFGGNALYRDHGGGDGPCQEGGVVERGGRRGREREGTGRRS